MINLESSGVEASDWNRAIELNPQAWVAFSGRARALSQRITRTHSQADKDQAYGDAMKAGDGFESMGKHNAAAEEYEYAAGFRPQAGEPELKHGIALEATGNIDRALLSYEIAASDFEKTRDYAGVINSNTRLIEATARLYKSTDTTYRFKMAKGYTNVCRARVILGDDLAQAINDCNKALELSPNDAELLYARGLAKRKGGDQAGGDKDVRDRQGHHGELLMLGFEVAQSTVSKYMVRGARPPSQSWKTFLRNHADAIAGIDLCVVPTVSFERLFAFLVVGHGRRQLLWFEVTRHPTAEWLARQIIEAFPWESAPAYLVRDNDRAYGHVFTARVRAMGIRDRPITPASPWQNGIAER